MNFNLSVTRKIVQLGAFALLVFGAPLIGYYTADKLSGALPALSCAYDLASADFCALVPLEHQMGHRVGSALAQGSPLWPALLPTLTTLGTFLMLFVLLNKAFCGWICPLGTFQELVGIVGGKLGLARIPSLPAPLVEKLRPLKWAMLAVLVFGLPLLSGLGFVGHELVGAYCAVCPSRIVTSLITGDSGELAVDTASPLLMGLSVAGDFLFGAVVAFALTLRQPFCRICPMLALHAAFRKLGLARLLKRATPRCEKCGLCAQACPMDIREIQSELTRRDVTFADCTLCGRCVEFCPEAGVLELRYAGLKLFGASPAYFKRRKQAQGRWERWSVLKWLRRSS